MGSPINTMHPSRTNQMQQVLAKANGPPQPGQRAFTRVCVLCESTVSRNRAYWAYSVRKPMKRMKIMCVQEGVRSEAVQITT